MSDVVKLNTEEAIAKAKALIAAAEELADGARKYLEEMKEMRGAGANVDALQPFFEGLSKETANMEEDAKKLLVDFVAGMIRLQETENEPIRIND